VDPDANIIVGSAFSDELNGRMRVSVVATGIEASQPSLALPVQPQPAPAFQAPGASLSGTAPAPFTRTPEPVMAEAVAHLHEAEPVAVAVAEPAAPEPAPLMLSVDDLVEEAASPSPPSNVTPLRAPLPAPVAEVEEVPTRGPTLFERMMGAKSASK